MAYYVDTSAAAKLVVTERHSAAMLSWAREHDGELVSSDLLRTELLRAVRNTSPSRLRRVRQVIESMTLLKVRTDVFERASELEPAALRSLDSLHLASALDLGDDLQGLVTYDDRLAAGAGAHGIEVITPS
jgi:predicted nucleic acid-binding protein